jgi:cytochrome c553
VARTDALSALREQLGAAMPDGLSELSDHELRHLAAAISEARHRQAQALAEAGERALGHIPRLLRGPVRRIVG